MPWTPKDAPSHTKEANTPHLRRLWAAAANAALKEYKDEGRAIRVADAAVNKEKKKKDSEEKSNKIIRDLAHIVDRF